MKVLLNHWYVVLQPQEVGRKPLTVERFGQPLVFWRGSDGQVHAQHDRCPHLGASLGAGQVVEDRLVCPFHGFRYDGDGRCRHAPALGKNTTPPKGLVLKTFMVREAHDLVWLWWGDPALASPDLPFFALLQQGWQHYTVSTQWPVHYTRAIENQLDVAHLPFVHRTTIGAGGRTLVEGPYVEADERGVRVWVSNHVDDGRTLRTQPQLAAAFQGHEPSLDLRFPGCWLLSISPVFKNFLAFVPVNERCTRYYLRSYFRFGPRWLARPLGWLISLSNRYILGQDRRVVITQTPADSGDAHHDQLTGADRAIAQFRRFHSLLLQRQASTLSPPLSRAISDAAEQQSSRG